MNRILRVVGLECCLATAGMAVAHVPAPGDVPPPEIERSVPPVDDDVPPDDRRVPPVEEDRPPVKPRQPELAGLSGEWFLENGEVPDIMVLRQEGDRVTGSFEAVNARVSGTIKDGKLYLTWTERGGRGSAVLVLAKDQKAMAGKWEGPAGSGTWSLVKLAPADE